MKYLLIFGLLSFFNPLFSQTKTEKETINIDTDNPAITMEAKKNGTYLEVRVYNNHNVSYNISFTTEVTIRGIKGDLKKTLQTSGYVGPNKSNYAFTYIGWADVSNDIYFSLEDASNINFSAQLVDNQIQSSTNYSNNNTNSKNTTSVNNDPKPGPNASVQELAAWQRRQNTVNNASTTTTDNQNYNNYNNTTATQNNNNNNNQGVTQADLNALLERNAQESNRVLGLSPSNDNKATEQVVSEGLWSLADSWVQARQERLEREEREEERKRILVENERIEKEKRQRIINNRSIIINKFNAKDIPLSSREKASKIYYFIYSFENNNLNQEYGATVYVSNVFEIGTFNDGTRAYTSTVKNEIINLTPFNEVLHGYYYSEAEAESIRKSFIELLKNNGVSILNISYKGKPGTKTATTTSNLTQTNESKYGKTININDQNFAPATLNDSKRTEVPKRNIEKAEEKEKKKQSKYGKTIKIE